MRQRKVQNMTRGVIWKQILRFFFPILIGALFQQLYNTVDAVVVGQFAGKEALSSVGGSSAQILNFVFSFFIGLSTGSTVVIAQYFGAEQDDAVDTALHTSYLFACLCGLVLGGLGVLFTTPLLELLGTPEELMAQSGAYIRILFGGLVFTLIFNMGSGILRAVGDSKRPLYVLMACCLMNIVLDLLFVMQFHLGASGAAIATNISQAASAAAVTWLLVKKTPGMKLCLKRLRISRPMLARILQIGFPTALAGSMFSISNMVIQTAINGMGVDPIAAWTAYGKVDSLWWMIDQAFSTAVVTFVGQNFGAGLADRIERGIREVLVMEILMAFGASLFMNTCGEFLLGLFTTDQTVVSLGSGLLRFITPFYAVYVINEVLSSALRAEGYVMVSTVVNFVGVCIYRVCWVSLFCPEGSTMKHVLSCYPASWICISVIMAVYYLFHQKRILAKMRGRRVEQLQSAA